MDGLEAIGIVGAISDDLPEVSPATSWQAGAISFCRPGLTLPARTNNEAVQQAKSISLGDCGRPTRSHSCSGWSAARITCYQGVAQRRGTHYSDFYRAIRFLYQEND